MVDRTVVPAGEGDGEVAATVVALLADGFGGFFSLEPHLKAGERYGGYSGPDLFRVATHAFTAILDRHDIPYH
ncbi:hypothetical protein [Phytoactinopolyspora limicola]|uniref:hypothetical protein n=1 Tax=Phytoactinopolyspora limicola TaxID=2715536 RepID=UPI001A9C3774|nr:hypothetical protein [Phytoactinopolyspora limicola]